MKLANRASIVTGGAQGIGRATCLALAREGSDVMVADIEPHLAEGVSEEIRGMGRESLSFEVDVSNGKRVREMVRTALDALGRIDVLVNVAGIPAKPAGIEDVSEEDWDRVMAVNLKGTFLCGQAVGREMIKQGGGSIVNLSSVAAHSPQIYSGPYSPSKAGIILLTKVMAVEWAKYNIRVNALSPGPIRTRMTDAMYDTEAKRGARTKSIPMNRFGSPEEVANAVVFLASDELPYVTGQTLVMDGGALDSMFYMAGLLAG